jgi:dynein heavy chain 2
VGELSRELEELPMRALLGAAFITYLPNAPEDVRRDKIHGWMDAIGIKMFDLRRFLSTESEQLKWKAEGLPSDELSMENALVILQVHIIQSNRWRGVGKGVGGRGALYFTVILFTVILNHL